MLLSITPGSQTPMQNSPTLPFARTPLHLTSCTDSLLGTWADTIPLISQIHRHKGPFESTNANCRSDLTLLEIENALLDCLTQDNRSSGGGITGIDIKQGTEDSQAHLAHGALQTVDFPSWSHWQSMARAYRLSALLRLYQLFPAILSRRLPVLQDSSSLTAESYLRDLALHIMALLRSIPTTNRLFNVCSFPLMTAAQYCSSLEHRGWVMELLEHLRVRNGIAAISILGRTLTEVWRRRDAGEDTLWPSIFEEYGWTMMIN